MDSIHNIGAVCILEIRDPDDASIENSMPRTYKVVYTKNCVSQIKKHYKSLKKEAIIHAYKYATKTDVINIRERLLLYQANIKTDEIQFTFFITLDDLFDVLLEYFEPELF